MAKHRKAKELGLYFLDTTAMTGVSAFAPLMSNVLRYKAGQLLEDEYTTLYYAKMRSSFSQSREQWDALKERENIVVACYCAKDKFCHRHLFVTMLVKFLNKEGIEVELMGELT